MGGDPSRALATPTTPLESTMVGNAGAGIRSASSTLASQPVWPLSRSPVTPALDASVAKHIAARQVPRHPGVDGADAQVTGAVGVGLVEQVRGLGGRLVRREAQPLGLPDEAVADRAQVLPAEAGADGLAGRPVPGDGRGPLVGDADGRHRPAGGQRRPGDLERRVGQGGGVELDQAGGGGGGEDGPVLDGGDRRIRAHHRASHPRRADVDDEDRAGFCCCHSR